MNSRLFIPLSIGLFSLVFFLLVFSFFSGNKIQFTNLSTQEKNTESIQTKDDPVYGGEDAQLTIVHFGDFSSTSSASIAQSLKTIADNNDAIAIVWKDFPNTSLHQESLQASIAAHCADKQHAFWDYHDLLFAYQNDLNEELYTILAQELDLWEWSFNRCLSKEKTQDIVQSNYQQGQQWQIPSAPTIFIGSEQYTGLLSTLELNTIITSHLSK